MSDDLIARLEAVAEGSRELSDEVLLICGWRTEERGEIEIDLWWSPEGRRVFSSCQPDPTRSLDAALSLVSAGRRSIALTAAIKWCRDRRGLEGNDFISYLALAVCITTQHQELKGAAE